MSADRKYEVECQAVGSRPPAKISWWMGNVELFAHNQKVNSFCRCFLYSLLTNLFPQVSIDGNVSISTLAITPAREDHGKVVSCRVTNELVKNGVKENVIKLNVFCEYFVC